MKTVQRGFLFLVFFCGLVLPLTAQKLDITRGAMTAGEHIRIFQPYAPAYCEFLLTNKTGKAQKFLVKVQSAKTKGMDACFSKVFTVPAASERTGRILLRLDGSTEYSLNAFVQPENILIESEPVEVAYVKTEPERERIFLVLSDDYRNTGGDFIRNRQINRCYAAPLLSKNLPPNISMLEQYSVILISKADFRKWKPAYFDLILQYVNEGGTLLFLSPEDVRNAAATPLAKILPFSRTESAASAAKTTLRKIFLSAYGTMEMLDTPMEIRSVTPAKDAVILHRASGKTVLAEKKYGKGVCRASAVNLAKEGLTYVGDGWNKLLAHLLRSEQPPIPCPESIRYTREDNLLTADSGNCLLELLPDIGEPVTAMLALTVTGLAMLTGSLLLAILCFILRIKFWKVLLLLLVLNGCAAGIIFATGGAICRYLPVEWLKNIIGL